MHNTTTRFLTALLLLTTSSAALAHPGHVISGFSAGVLHPFHGLDHLLAMLAVGLWAATLGGTAAWKIPAAFVTVLITGAMLGMNGFPLPLVEPFIALSVLLLGLALTLTLRVPTTIAIMACSLFALFHGHAHGSELPTTASSYVCLLGMTLASSALHLTGFAIGRALKNHIWLLRSSGTAVAAMGMWLVVGV